jgi:hypothetical protein
MNESTAVICQYCEKKSLYILDVIISIGKVEIRSCEEHLALALHKQEVALFREELLQNAQKLRNFFSTW